MNNNIFVYFDNRVIAFVHSVSKANMGNYRLLETKPAWSEIISFLNDNKEKTIYASTRPEVHFKHFMTFFMPLEAAGGLVMNDTGKWLFIFRNKRWDLPKGLIEENENSEQAAIREIQEECGITNIKTIQKLPPTYHIYQDKNDSWILKKTHWHLMKTLNNSTPTAQTEEGITKVEWHDPNDIDAIMENTYGNIRDLLHFCKKQSFGK